MSAILMADGSPAVPVEPPEPEMMALSVAEYRELVQAAADVSMLQTCIATLARLKGGKVRIAIWELAKTEELGKRVRYYEEHGKNVIFECIDGPKKEEKVDETNIT